MQKNLTYIYTVFLETIYKYYATKLKKFFIILDLIFTDYFTMSDNKAKMLFQYNKHT